ncbi:glycerate kinase, partial [Patulibacter sp. NPDC049589]|uniref:glycerate kinase n=1 Tax=Patulibacter sp. NPDC049589 TaxID=3154731 RepID=UPI00341332F7
MTSRPAIAAPEAGPPGPGGPVVRDAPDSAVADAAGPVVLCAPDKLRGAVDAAGAARALAEGVREAGGRPILLPVADGGEGTLDAVLACGLGRAASVPARDAHGGAIVARIAVLHDRGAAAHGEAAPD